MKSIPVTFFPLGSWQWFRHSSSFPQKKGGREIPCSLAQGCLQLAPFVRRGCVLQQRASSTGSWSTLLPVSPTKTDELQSLLLCSLCKGLSWYCWERREACGSCEREEARCSCAQCRDRTPALEAKLGLEIWVHCYDCNVLVQHTVLQVF